MNVLVREANVAPGIMGHSLQNLSANLSLTIYYISACAISAAVVQPWFWQSITMLHVQMFYNLQNTLKFVMSLKSHNMGCRCATSICKDKELRFQRFALTHSQSYVAMYVAQVFWDQVMHSHLFDTYQPHWLVHSIRRSVIPLGTVNSRTLFMVHLLNRRESETHG